MATNITGSPNIITLDSRIVTDLCSGEFVLDTSPTVYQTGGALSVLGASFKIVNPAGITVKDYPTSGYDIDGGGSPAMAGDVSFDIPTVAGNYQYSAYVITLRMTDEDGTEYEDTKTVTICVPDSKNKTRKYGSLSALLKGNCTDGKLTVIVDGVPNYRGQVVESTEQSFTLNYPTASSEANLTTELDAFSVQLYEGEFKLTGTICATYNFGDNVYISVLYKVKAEKNIKCIIDECCVFESIASLQEQLKTDCSPEELAVTKDKIAQSIALYQTAKLAAYCGQDPSDYIADLEAILGCKCTCNCNEGTPIINSDPATDYTFTGCGFIETTAGLTKNIEINNYTYVVDVAANGGILTVQSTTTNDCTTTTVLAFNLTALLESLRVNNGLIYNADTNYIQQGGSFVKDTDLNVNGNYVRYYNGSDMLFKMEAAKITITATTVLLGRHLSSTNDTGTFAPVNFLYTDTTGILYSSPLLVDNGLTKTVGGNFKLGGTLKENTTLNLDTFLLTVSNSRTYFTGKVGVGVDNSGTFAPFYSATTTLTAGGLLTNTQAPSNTNDVLGGWSIMTVNGGAFTQSAENGIYGHFSALYLQQTGDQTLLGGVAALIGALNLSNTNAAVITSTAIISAVTGSINATDNGAYSNIALFKTGVLSSNTYASRPVFSGAITNFYALYIDDQSGSTTNGNITNTYAIYQAGLTDINFFKAKFTIYGTIAGSTGAQTIDKSSGQIQIAAGQRTVVVTNALVKTTSLIELTIEADDATATSAYVSAKSSGSFTIKLNATATGTVKVGFWVRDIV